MRWPDALPQELLLSGFSNSLGSGAARTEMEAGPKFQRPRVTVVPEPVTGAIVVTRAQYLVFRQFYKTDLAEGAIEFEWHHPITGYAADCQFDTSQPPEPNPYRDDLYELEMTLEVLREYPPVVLVQDGELY